MSARDTAGQKIRKVRNADLMPLSAWQLDATLAIIVASKAGKGARLSAVQVRALDWCCIHMSEDEAEAWATQPAPQRSL